MREIFLPILNLAARDYVDILLVSLFFYGVFALLRETRSFVALTGFIICTAGSLILYLAARTWNLHAMTLLFQHFWTVFVIIFIIVFQNEFRRALTELGQIRLLRVFFPHREVNILGEIEQAVIAMAQERIGALICIERRNPLNPYTSNGTQLDAMITSELIRTIFTMRAPLHDGALMVQGERLLAAGCILPLTANTEISSDLGTRHRAAIGLSEQTDSLIIVVSEETGIISLVADGRIERNIRHDALRRQLEAGLDIESEKRAPDGASAA